MYCNLPDKAVNFVKKICLKKKYLLADLFILLLFCSCTRIDLYEKLTPVPKHEWRSNFKPRFDFNIKDTLANYQLYLILRHNDRYHYNNIWLNVFIKGPDNKVQKFQIEKILATNTSGWLASGMDDIYEHRLPLTAQPITLSKPGRYSFIIEQTMREDPLENIMDVGLRLEKTP
jgi:gliding motility-associated lipoprotein GldH